jgi:nucleoside-diphosphate-sugar epimerase
LPTNIGNPAEMTILDFAQRIRGHFQNAPAIIYEALPQDDPKRRCPDISKARKLLGWEPKVALDEGLALTLAYFKTQYRKEAGSD